MTDSTREAELIKCIDLLRGACWNQWNGRHQECHDVLQQLDAVLAKLPDLSDPPRCREAEGDSKDADIADVIHGASFLSNKDDAVEWAASKAWKKGYYAGRSQQIPHCLSVGNVNGFCGNEPTFCTTCVENMCEKERLRERAKPIDGFHRDGCSCPHCEDARNERANADQEKPTCKPDLQVNPPPASDEEIADKLLRDPQLDAKGMALKALALGRAEVLDDKKIEPVIKAVAVEWSGLVANVSERTVTLILRDFVEQLSKTRKGRT